MLTEPNLSAQFGDGSGGVAGVAGPGRGAGAAARPGRARPVPRRRRRLVDAAPVPLRVGRRAGRGAPRRGAAVAGRRRRPARRRQPGRRPPLLVGRLPTPAGAILT